MSCKDQGTEFEFTVVQKFNHSSFPSRLRREAVYRLRGPFLGTFLGKQKGTGINQNIIINYIVM